MRWDGQESQWGGSGSQQGKGHMAGRVERRVPSQASSGVPTASCRACEMDPALFEVPRGYSVVGTHQDTLREDEDDLLQFAIQQSLLEAGSEYDQVGTATPRLFLPPRPRDPAAHPIPMLTPTLPIPASHGGGSEFMLGGGAGFWGATLRAPLCHPPQVTIWEALTNSKPGTHPMSHEGRRGDRLVRSGQRPWGERVRGPGPRGPH